MSELDYRCTHCGAMNSIEEETNDYFVCSFCGAKIYKNKSDEFSKRIKELHLEEETKELSNYRVLLDKAINEDDYTAITNLSSKILYLIPNDFSANLFYKFGNKLTNPKSYEETLNALNNYEFSDFEPYLTILINHATFYELDILEKLILKNETIDNNYLDLINQRQEKLDLERDLFANIKRDVFICHSSKDSVLLEKIVQKLEREEGFSTWYSERNLAHDTTNYWKGIEEAIINSEVFLLVITENAKFSKDVKEEITLCKNLGKEKIAAYFAMDENPGIEIREFLSSKGAEWITATEEDSLGKLAKRIYDLKKQTSSKQENTKNTNTNTTTEDIGSILKNIVSKNIETGKMKVASVLSETSKKATDFNSKAKEDALKAEEKRKADEEKAEEKRKAAEEKAKAKEEAAKQKTVEAESKANKKSRRERLKEKILDKMNLDPYANQNALEVIKTKIESSENNYAKVKEINNFVLPIHKEELLDVMKYLSPLFNMKEYKNVIKENNISIAVYYKMGHIRDKALLEFHDKKEYDEINNLMNEVWKKIKRYRLTILFLNLLLIAINITSIVFCTNDNKTICTIGVICFLGSMAAYLPVNLSTKRRRIE